ncbi:MAG: hypothetical protein QOI35_884, partial [Cryptosporangiaceae bacterium]|nr:hypothetical protein [Cryptosporangiaceae bacterium]
MPWKKVRITTVSTPPLAGVEGTTTEPLTRIAADPGYGQPYFGSDAFWPVVPSAQGPTDFLFALEGEDAQGRRSQFTTPLVFVRGAISDDATHTKKIVDEYMAPAAAARRQRSLGGQRVTLTSLPGQSTYPVDSVTLGAEQPDPPNADLDYRHQPRFFPVLTGAGVRLDAVEQVSGKPAGSGPAQIAWYAPYLKGTDLNPGQLFASLPNAIDLGFPADALGALATPDLRIGGLSSLTGIVGGSLPAIPPINFDPAAFFAGAAPKILGALPLTAILDAIDFSLPDQLPQLLKAEVPDKITTSYTWRPKIRHDDDYIFDPGQTGALTIRATTTVRRSGGAPSFEIVGELTNFALNAFGVKDFGMLTLNFRKLRFAARDGLKATVDADLSGVTFHGVLEFINPLQDFLAKLGMVPPRQSAAATHLNPGKAMAGKALAKTAGSDPPPNGPDISVTAAGIRAGYTLAVPTVSVGVFSLENIVLSSVLNIPFLGDPARVRFAFADRERPFLLTVAMFGGGGFCALQLGLDGFERFEAALEFGAKLGLDLGVASGGVSVMAGIYFALGKTEGELSGYVRINGELRILGLISLGLEFYLGMTYETSTGEVSGQARLTVSIDIAFFSTSVTLGPIEKRFGGGTKVPPGGNAAMAANGKPNARALAPSPYAPPPGLADLMSQADWADPTAGYCAMFAPTAFA